MSTIDRSDPNVTLEPRLRSWMSQTAAEPASTDLYDAIVLATRGAPQRPWFLAGSRMGASGGIAARSYTARQLTLALLAVVLIILAVISAALVGGRLLDLRPRSTLPGAFVPTDNVPEAAAYLIRPAVAKLADGRVLLVNGSQGAPGRPMALVYDPTTGTYGSPVSLDAPIEGGTATTLADGRVLVAGGTHGETGAIVATAELFDPATNAIAPTGSLNIARDHHTATLLADGRVLITGGSAPPVGTSEPTFMETIASSELYDPRTRAFTPTGPLATGRAGQTATRLESGKVIVVGGYSVDQAGKVIVAADAEIYDPGTGTFSLAGTLDTPRADHTATLLSDGRLLVVGGGSRYDGYGDASGPILQTAELFDPATGRAVPTGSLTTERSGHSATLLDDGRVLVAGGGSQFGPARTAELYDPTTGTFAVGARATDEHRFGFAPLLADGRVFLGGAGRDQGSETELYDPKGNVAAVPFRSKPATGPFRPVTTTMARSEHTATRLLDGRVLIAGGYGGPDNGPLSSAELFDPATGASTATGSMTVARSDAIAVSLTDGRVLIASEGTADIFDPAAGSFSSAQNGIARALNGGQALSIAGAPGRVLVTRRDKEGTATVLDVNTGMVGPTAPVSYWADGAVALPDGRVLILSVMDDPLQILDPVAGTVETTTIHGRWAGASLLPDGRVALMALEGGEVDAVRSRVTQVYDPSTGTVQGVDSPRATSDTAGVLVTLLDGRILVIGSNSATPGDAASLLEPAPWAWRTIDSLLTPRLNPTATLLLDGRVLIVGGETRSPDRIDPIPPDAELFDPSLLP